ncbi:ABC transporter ATP-binding protein [Paenibacillus aquistagni]|uniref:Teichoic acid transport system ATP-binding protein n=1 Tax=Paenibacillus aquistagni TaxID=1852522 RepID=A0A1X7KY34_9BACL|nr:ABC transporter ATP-binding protein [Paenibacillus aquistagni]SMG46548.1 teichoic acid transport system ATP-binding protein [Paenibacillus aquistagni]
MEPEVALKVENVTKVYKLYDKPVDRLKEAMNPLGKNYHTEFYAVKNISFELKKGETVGIIGKNGSGKSTLLKMITGVLLPSAGKIDVDGKISALLELGAGFNPEYTGMENIYLNGTIMGLKKEEVDAKLKDILDFADIGDFIYQPVKMYSSGMFARLAFAVAINVDPDILIVDEALSVGDVRFQQKCYRKIEEFKDKKTVVMVTHDTSAIVKYCDRSIWINEGVLMGDGDPLEISKQYQAFMIDSSISKKEVQTHTYIGCNDDIDSINPSLDILGDKDAEIIGVSIFDEVSNIKTTMLTSNQRVKLSLKIRANQDIIDPIIGFTLKDRLGSTIFQTNTFALNQKVTDLKKNEVAIFSFCFEFPSLNHGTYTISPAIASGTQGNHIQHCWVHDAIIVRMLHSNMFQLEGYLLLDSVDFCKEI